MKPIPTKPTLPPSWAQTQVASNRWALSEPELAARWGISAKTLRRWRQERLGPVFCKFGHRVTYLLDEITAFERRAARYSTSARVWTSGEDKCHRS